MVPLRNAAKYVGEVSGGRASILLWDAYRSPATQRAIFDEYRARLQAEHAEWSPQFLHEQTRDFVSDPDGIFPHGTGGAVDITLIVDGREAFLGSEFDEFGERSYRNYFQEHPPSTDAERSAALYRGWLMDAFDCTGWAGLEQEWWHYEWGTVRWALAKGNTPILTEVLAPPTIQPPTEKNRTIPRLQPAIEDGVAPDFSEPEDRAAGLAHVEEHFYYARNDHSASNGLAAALKDLTEAKQVVLFPSGKAACVVALDALVPVNGRLVCDRGLYYEVDSAIREFERDRERWQSTHIDLKDIRRLAEVLGTFQPHVVYLDNPRNWFLDSFDVSALRACMNEVCDALLVVDTTLQPLQRALVKGADVCVLSLSKYPSNGFELGGAALFTDPGKARLVRDKMELWGNPIGLSSAHKIWEQVMSLQDRMVSLSPKVISIADSLRGHPAVTAVRVPDAKHLDGLVGGQLSFHVKSPRIGCALEKIVGHNATNPNCPMRLACTFGASISTVEHFASNPRKRERLAREETNEILIPDDIVRLGVGSRDTADRITKWLTLGLDGAMKL